MPAMDMAYSSLSFRLPSPVSWELDLRKRIDSYIGVWSARAPARNDCGELRCDHRTLWQPACHLSEEGDHGVKSLALNVLTRYFGKVRVGSAQTGWQDWFARGQDLPSCWVWYFPASVATKISS